MFIYILISIIILIINVSTLLKTNEILIKIENYDTTRIKKKSVSHNKDNKKYKIIEDIKKYYKQFSILKNEYNTGIKKIIDMNLFVDNYNNYYCDVLYVLNNNKEENRRITIDDKGDILNFGNIDTGFTCSKCSR